MTMYTVRSRASGTQRVTNALNEGRAMPECCRPNSASSSTLITTEGTVARCGPASTVFGNHQPPANSSSTGTVTPAKAYPAGCEQNGDQPTAVGQHVLYLVARDQIHANQGRYRERTVPSSNRLSSLAFQRLP